MVQFENVSFRYTGEENVNCLNHINLKIKSGELVLLCGPSGSGKSTVTRLINGLIPHYYEGELKGKVTLKGHTVADYPLYEIAQKVGTVFQNPRSQFFNVDTTSELAFGCENMGMPEKEILERIRKTVKALRIEKLMDRSIFNLSGGEKQKIACASVSVSEPEVMVLDEPSANLDTDAIEDLKGLISLWKSKGKTIIVSEHRLSYIWNIADRVVIMKDGSIVRDMLKAEFEKFNDDDIRHMGLRSLYQEDVTNIKRSVHQGKGDIILKNFVFGYKKGKNILNIEELRFPKGEITAIVGANGVGKSTFLHCLCGLKKKCKGIIKYKGKSYNNKQRLKLMYMVMQDVNHQLFTETVLDEIMISMKELNEKKAKKILNQLNLLEYAQRHPISLSGGQKQRVAIATAIASEREILLFDEPTSGLDYGHMIQVSKLLKKLKRMGKTVLVVTHDMELIHSCCTQIVHLNKSVKKTNCMDTILRDDLETERRELS